MVFFISIRCRTLSVLLTYVYYFLVTLSLVSHIVSCKSCSDLWTSRRYQRPEGTSTSPPLYSGPRLITLFYYSRVKFGPGIFIRHRGTTPRDLHEGTNLTTIYRISTWVPILNNFTVSFMRRRLVHLFCVSVLDLLKCPSEGIREKESPPQCVSRERRVVVFT